MTYQPHYIAAFEQDSGLNTYYEPFLAPDKAFPVLEDAYCWRGRVKRRQGFSLLGRLRRVYSVAVTLSTQANGAAYANADILADASINVRAPAGAIAETYAEIQPGTLVVVVGGVTFTDAGDGTLTGAPAGNSGTINYITGALALSFNPALGVPTNVNVTFAYYPSLPVMGLRTREATDINQEQLVAFDRKYAYRLTAGQFEELPSVAATTWLGSDSDFFWSTNYWRSAAGNGLFWATNFNKTVTPDPIRYYDGATWTTFNPVINAAGDMLEQARIILPYKDRLVCLNTYEGASLAAAIQYPRRARWSQNGSPIDLVNAWREDVVGRGGYIDAPTNEHIVSAQFIKDVLIVKFERSSWKLVYTGNEVLPFVWQKINTEMGAESTFSLVPFDDGVLAVGNYGITADDSVSVRRIDEQIPQTVFDFNNDNNGVQRVHGIRDFSNELVYWTYPNSTNNPTFPNKILVYNYKNHTYAKFNDSFTCFGYYQRISDETWASFTDTSWVSYNKTWNAGASQSSYPDIAAGNQEGFVLILSRGIKNATSLSITSINTGVVPNQLTVINHNLQNNQFVKITGIIGTLSVLNNKIYRVQRVSDVAISLQLYNSVTGLFDNVDVGAGTYLGGGQLTVFNNLDVRTKIFAPFYDSDGQCRVAYIDFLLDTTDDGEIIANIFLDEDNSTPINDPAFPTPLAPTVIGLMGSNILLTRPENATLYPNQVNQLKIWHRMFVQAIAQNIQIQLTMSDAQMSDETIASSEIVVHAIAIYLSRNARLTP